ncbi:hypothetical protein M1D47_09930 [Bacillus sp. R1-10]
MKKSEKIKAFSELYNLINFYYENRDKPNTDFDFFNEVQNYCNILELDFSEFKEEFKLNQKY